MLPTAKQDTVEGAKYPVKRPSDSVVLELHDHGELSGDVYAPYPAKVAGVQGASVPIGLRSPDEWSLYTKFSDGSAYVGEKASKQG